MSNIGPTEDWEADKEEASDAANAAAQEEKKRQEQIKNAAILLFCFLGLQCSYLTWGFVQEKVMTTDYEGGRFPSATFCVFSNRTFAIIVAACIVCYQHGGLRIPAPMIAFAPCSISNTLSSYGQYEALNYVSFPLQTISKSTKVVPVMLMGKVLNKKKYKWVEYLEAVMISAGVSVFALDTASAASGGSTELKGIACLALYIIADSFTSQWQSRVYREHKGVDQYQMMFAVNVWSILFTLGGLLANSEFFSTLTFLQENPPAIWDQVLISVTSATGQLFIYYTIKKFGPVVFTIIMTTRQVFSMVLSTIYYRHPMTPIALLGASVVFGTIFYRIHRGQRQK